MIDQIIDDIVDEISLEGEEGKPKAWISIQSNELLVNNDILA